MALAFLATGLAFSSPLAATAEESDALAWLDTSKTAEERANLLLEASTLHQKYRWLNEQAANSPDVTTFGGVTYPVQVDGTPLVIYANGPEGVHGTAGTTAWPAPISIASTWNLELGEAKAAAHGSESFDQRKAVVLGPGMASGRNPMSGRTPEYFGEDPLLTGLMGAANVLGLEQGNEDKPVLSNIKHYVANEQELDRESSSSNIDERTLRQVYDLPYEIAVAESDPGSVMCSYNQINGVYACENPILNTHLRDQFGFDGYVMSDFGAVHSTAAALKAGLDQELNRPIFYTPEKLDAALAAEEITLADIDTAAFNVVKTYIEIGLFDHLVPDAAIPNVSTPEHKALARELAEQGTVLLKNDGALPIASSDAGTIAVIGQTASATPTNGVSAKTACAAYMPFTRGPVLNCDAIVDPLTAITERAEEAGATVLYDSGADPVAAAAVAAQADTTIVFGYISMGEFSDPTDLLLDGNGDALIEAVAAASDNTVVMLGHGSMVEMPWIDDVEAVFAAWYAGEQQGPAMASLLWGDVNPSGKLPMSFAKTFGDTAMQTEEQYPGVFADGSTERTDPDAIRQVNYTEGLEVGYKWFDEQGIDPLFEFGFGLSYTSFEYSDLAVETTVDQESGTVSSNVAFTVTNTGDVAGDEIPQVYLTLPEAAAEPGKRLVGFDRIALDAGATERVEVVVDSPASNHPFSIWDVDAQAWTIVDGEFEVSVAASSRDIRLTEAVAVEFGEVAPVVTLTADPAAPSGANDWYTSPVTVTATATDDIDAAPVVEIDVDGAGFVPAASVTLDADGTHTVSARATDAAGNVSETVTWQAKLDQTAPTVDASADRTAETIVLTGTDATSGIASIEYAVLDAAGDAPESWTTYAEPIAVDADGTVVAYRATDAAGNVSTIDEFEYENGAVVPTPAPSPAPGGGGSDLASTGFAAGGIALAAALLIGAGVILTLRRRKLAAAE
ncbi:glycoside hydrolase family 3 C-terminal domain-containing protein [Agromyces atrinae]|uniref:beta-glucosidase n=1 Tax=Agromyces atrinae TaxID=592376 RepID=UPI001F597611|nr:glycoside hydrolase family 3 C-terminal domain-containing protein [Agromyces atrinae]MCI2957128.1 glycoside hydrolase family 3 C-terminal domain-containing protein [Agromyces atrinae]